MKVFKIDDFERIEGFLSYHGVEEIIVSEVIAFDKTNIKKNVLMWINEKNIDQLQDLEFGTIITPRLPAKQEVGVNYILVKNPRLFFTNILLRYFVDAQEVKISGTATISPSSSIGRNVYIGENVIIEANVIIGDNSFIDHNTVIKKGTVIGDFVKIGSNNTIGGLGFGYEKDDKGNYFQIPHLGNVVIEDYVEIGNNTCIDRAVLGSTLIKKNAKIDNLVHIAHGVIIGSNSLIIANSMVAGSTIVGENVWVAPSSSILNKIKIGDNAVIGMAAVVLKNVEDKDVVVGMPAKSIKRKEL